MTARKKILLIDDEPEIQDLLAAFLNIRGYDGIVAVNGNDGVQKAKDVKPDLILLDIMMPQLDGFATQRKLSAEPSTRDIPILFITAKAEVENAQLAIMEGAAGYLEKPFDLDALSAKIESILEKP